MGISFCDTTELRPPKHFLLLKHPDFILAMFGVISRPYGDPWPTGSTWCYRTTRRPRFSRKTWSQRSQRYLWTCRLLSFNYNCDLSSHNNRTNVYLHADNLNNLRKKTPAVVNLTDFSFEWKFLNYLFVSNVTLCKRFQFSFHSSL